MKIGGLFKFSLSDFPGRVAAVVFTQGCNFRCPFCHNSSLIRRNVTNGSLIPEEEFFEFLKLRNSQLDAVVISGGEPTIQPDMSKLLCRIKAMGFLVKLDTNGSKPNVLQDLLKNNLVDYIAMDIKAPLHMYNRLSGVRAPISQVKESIALISQSGIAHEFRTTVVKSLLSVKDVRAIQRKLVPSGSTLRLQKFCPEHAFDPALRKYTNIYSGDLPL